MKKSFIMVMIFVLVCSFALTGLAADKKVFRFAENGEPPNMDPHHSFNPFTQDVTYATLEGLTRINGGKVQAGMAESWDLSEDGLTYTFHIRDAKWSDGKPVTAQDFEYSFLRLFNPETHSDYGFFGMYVVGGEDFWRGNSTDPSTVGIKALDDKTLEIKLVTPKKFWLNLMGWSGFHPVRQDYVEKYGDSYGADIDKQVYNGPFLLKEWKHEESLLLVDNPDYWDKNSIKLDEVEMLIVPDPTTIVNMYETGQLDYAQLTKNDIPKYEAEGTLIRKVEPVIFWYHFQVGDEEKGEYLNNKYFRKAIGYAIDRNALANYVLANGSAPATRLIPPGIQGIKEKHTDEFPIGEEYFPLEAQPEQAQKYLDMALEELGKTREDLPAFEILVNDKAESRIVTEATQDMISKNLGLDIEIRLVPSKQKWDDMIHNRFEIVYAGWGPDFDDPINYLDTWVKGGGTNTMGWYNKEFEEAIQLINSTTDNELRAKTIDKAERILLDEAMLVPTYMRGIVYTVRDYVKNFRTDSIGMDNNYIYVDIQK